MANRFLLLLITLVLVSSCSNDDEDITIPKSTLSEYEVSLIDYFKSIALGFEFGNASKITRKWENELNIYIGGNPTSEILNELETVKGEINELATDGFSMNIVNDSLQSNYYIFFGSGDTYASLFPSQSNLVTSNWGLFSVFWNNQNQLTSGHMYVDIERADTTAQKHLLREELTQSLGLARDSPKYMESIFQSAWTTTTEYAPIDKDVIRLLYHPDMNIGLNISQVDTRLRKILSPE
ncbi:DUF2927 domain-containing protein [Aquimarina sp. TRL1]|uniref:DUF2927 domain-containing protein n=1 Tax=Aquimarina sp. (strain TRL1) TaxID=2736252 RepID=UPI0015886A01|nr:DUF2927 domain-containing protein [Aquimarina sp. TRL1]QKX03468.1 DUF2927 domain-containing protein [Aquimarina sp. TRL1]